MTGLPLSSQLKTVLLIEDNANDIKAIQGALQSKFRVSAVGSAREAFAYIFKAPPDLVILDINLPDLDGFHIAREVKKNMMLRHIPLIVLTNRIDFLEKMRSLDVIADEYVVRPFDLKDLCLRSELVLQRVMNDLDANPLTRLPGNGAIVKALKSKLGIGKPYAVGYADLNNFKSYNDKYGFNRGDALINYTAKVIVNALQMHSPQENFVGHVGGDDFIFICSYEKANEVCQTIIATFDKDIPKFYTEEDKKIGYIMVEDRRGIVSQFPFVSVAIGMVSDEGNKFQNLGQVNHSLTQLKKYAKSFQGSAYVRDRRSLTNQLAEFTWGPGSNAGSSKVLESITNALGNLMPSQLNDVIKNKNIHIVFQPIIDMKDDWVIGHESLVRGPAGTPLEFPDALFQTARTANLVPDLDLLCMEKMLMLAADFRRGLKLFVNIFPETLADKKFLNSQFNEGLRKTTADIIIELSGSQRATDVGELLMGLKALMAAGHRVCVDASVLLKEQAARHISDLRPNYIKLDMTRYRDMANDNRKHEEFQQVINFLRQIGSEIICAKLESRGDAFLAQKAGIKLGQGFLFALPSKSMSMTPYRA